MKNPLSCPSLGAAFIAMLFFAMTGAGDRPQVSVRVDGLSCPFCAFGLEKKLKSIDGVTGLEINVNEGVALLTFDDISSIDKNVIRASVKEAGFTPRDMVVKLDNGGYLLSLSIEGMKQKEDSKRIADALGKIECVDDLDIDVQTGRATFVCTDSTFARAKFVQAIQDLGYQAELEE